MPAFLGASSQSPLRPIQKPQILAQPPAGFFVGSSHSTPPPPAAAASNFSTVNMEDLSCLGVSPQAPPSSMDTESSIADAFLHLHFEGGDPLGGLLDDTPYSSLDSINTTEFRQMLSEGAGPMPQPGDHQATLLTYPESITRLVSQRRAGGEPGGDGGGPGGSTNNSFLNGLLGTLPAEDSFSSMVDLDLNSILNS